MSFKMIAPVALVVATLGLGACGDNGTAATSSAPASAPAKSMADVGTAMKAEADKLLADLGQYIKDNKWDLADKVAADLQKMKPNLPPEYGPKIDQLVQALAAAKAAAAKMPGGIKMP